MKRYCVRAMAWGIVAALGLGLAACGGATRATVRADDMNKVFPWPSRQDKVGIKVKPQTTMANTCSWFGSWEDVEVDRQVTFYVTEKTGKKFAYTPARSPIRRLAPVESIEIRWPLAAGEEEEQVSETQGKGAEKGEQKEKPEAKKPETGGEDAAKDAGKDSGKKKAVPDDAAAGEETR